MAEEVAAIDALPLDVQAALKDAQAVAFNSYRAYRPGGVVGVIALTRSGRSYSGCFVENASAGVTICAEPAALMAANTAGDRDVAALVIAGGQIENPAESPPCTPCGRCRQFAWEFAVMNQRDITLYCTNLALSRVLVVTLSELLPFPWGPHWRG